MSTPHLSIVIPAYNEEHRIVPTLETIRAWLDEQEFEAEVVVVDDGSTDDTVAVCEAALDGVPHRVLRHERNRGKGAGLKTGMVAADGEFVLFTDADLSTPIEHATEFLAAHATGAPVVIGTRKSAGASVLRRQHPIRENMGKVYTLLSAALICPGVSDFTCGFKCFSREAAQAIFGRLREDGWAYDSEVLFLARRLGYPVREVPVTWVNDPSSRVNLLRDAIGSFCGLLRIRWRALRGRYEVPTP